jgi:hypothetical protein
MREINYSGNPNGRLLCDTWLDVRLNGNDLATNEEVSINQNGNFLGYAKIIRINPMAFKEITTEHAFAICGNNDIYLRAILQKMYGFIDKDRLLFLITLQWTQRHLEEQQHLFNRFWDLAKEKHTTAYRESNKNKQFTLNF